MRAKNIIIYHFSKKSYFNNMRF